MRRDDMLTDDDDNAATNTVVTTTSSTTNASINTQAPVKKEVKLITRVTELLKAGCGGGILAESTSINEEFNHTRICMGLHSGLNILKSSVMTTVDSKDSNDGADGHDDAEYDLLLHPGDMMTLRKCNGNLGIVLVPIEEKKIDDDRMMMKKKMGDNIDAVKRDGVDSRKNNDESKDKGDDNNKTDHKNGEVIGENDTTIAVATELNTGKDGNNTDNIGESKKDDDRKENSVSAKNDEVNIKDNINDISSNNNNNNNNNNSNNNDNSNISSNNRNNIENGVTNNNENIIETSKNKADSIKNIEVMKKKLRSEVQYFGAKVPRGEWTHLAFIATTTPNNRFTLYMVCQLVYK